MMRWFPYVDGTMGRIVIGAGWDGRGERLLPMEIPTAVGGLGFIASAYLASPVPSIIALAIAAVGNTSTRGPFWALPTRFLTGRAAAGGIALINTVASLGGFVGPYIIGLVRKLTGGFAGGLVFLAVFMVIGAAAALLF